VFRAIEKLAQEGASLPHREKERAREGVCVFVMRDGSGKYGIKGKTVFICVFVSERERGAGRE